MSLPVQILAYEDLRGIAEDFLRQHHPAGTIPVPIERIIESKLEMDICPEMCIQDICDVDAFINVKCTAIHVDVSVYMATNDSRYRFSLAHEVAHKILHADIVAALPFRTRDEWKLAYRSIPEQDRSWIEWQAYALGGLLLVHREPLAREFRRLVDAFPGGLDPKMKDAIRHTINTELGKAFKVSRPVIEKRCEKDGLVY
jgi:hypothetical protein